MNRRRSVYFWIMLVCFIGGILLAQQYLKQQGSGLIPGSGGDFTLQSDTGPVSVADFKGKVVALYFGYMSCPDICPTSLWNLSAAMRMLPAEKVDQVQGIFISLDPERDSPRAMAIFVRGFFESFIGLTGTKENLDKIARQYSVIYEKVPLEDSAMGYVLDHTSVIYLLDRNGVLQYFVPHNTPPEAIKQDLVKLLSRS